MAHGFITGLFGVIPSGFARAKISPQSIWPIIRFSLRSWCWLVPFVDGMVGRGQKHLLLKGTKLLSSVVGRRKKKALLLVWRERTAPQRIAHRVLNTPLMWGYGTRLFVRHVIRRCYAFDARGFNHPLNLSITPLLCGPLLGLRRLHTANYWLCSTGNPIFKRQRGIVFIGFQNLARDKVNYAVVSSCDENVSVK